MAAAAAAAAVAAVAVAAVAAAAAAGAEEYCAGLAIEACADVLRGCP